MSELQAELQRLSNTTLDAPGAANAWAGTTGLGLLGALNTKAGLAQANWVDLAAVLNVLAGTTGKEVNGALVSLASPNLLTPNQAGLETDTTGWGASTNSTIARSTAQALDGGASLALTSVAAGDMQAATTTPGVSVIGGRTYTASAFYRANTVGRAVQTQIFWYTAASVFLFSDFAATVPDLTTGWTQHSSTAVAPPTAAFARIVPKVVATGAAGEVHYVDRISLTRV